MTPSTGTQSINDESFWDQVPAEYLRTLVEQGRENGLPTSIFTLGDPHHLGTPGVVVIKAGADHHFPRHCHDCERFEVVLDGAFIDATGHRYQAGDIMLAHHMDMYGPHIAEGDGYVVLELFGSMLGTYELFWDTTRGPRKANKIEDLVVIGEAPPPSDKVERGASFQSIHDDEFWGHVPAPYLQPLVDSCEPFEGMAYRMFVLGDPFDPESPAVVIFRGPPGYVLPRHSHECHRFEVVLTGSVTDEHGNVLTPGSVMTAQPSEMYGPSVAGPDGYVSAEIFSRLAGTYEITWDTDRGPWLHNILETGEAMTTLAGQAGIVTGAGSGIGRATALRLAEAGARVVVADIDETAARATVELMDRAGGTAIACRCDIADDAEVTAMVDLATSAFGRLDFAHNNAGVMGTQRRAADYALDDFDRIMRVNVRGTFVCMQAELRVMLQQGRGCIVNTASEAALKGSAADAVYTASKHAVAGLTKTTALEYARRGIRINAVCPGVILTGMMAAVEQSNPAGYEKAKNLMPVGRYGQPEEIAEAVLWLCSDASSLVTGHLLAVDGGWAVS